MHYNITYHLFIRIIVKANSISTDGVKAIAKSIEKNGDSALEVLDLSNNEIGTDGGKELAKAIKACKSPKLTTLLIKGGKIRDEGLKAFCMTLKANKSITSLDLESEYTYVSFQMFFIDISFFF